jgi:RIO kinase 1
VTDIQEILKTYANKGFNLYNPREVKSGKEATVYLVFLKNRSLALKVYKNHKTRAFQKNIDYIEGNFYRNPFERRMIKNNTKIGKDLVQRNWVRREYYLLNKLHRAGATVPEPLAWTPESILMEFIGDDLIAPRLSDTLLSPQQAKIAFTAIIKDIHLFLESGIVHGDLSAYNILWWQQKPIIIDLPQSIDIRSNPNKEMLLKRDLVNVMNYFKSYFEIDEESIYQQFGLVEFQTLQS